jgi:hypothetical protein
MKLSQLARFVRLFVFAAVPALVALGTGANKVTLAGAVALVTPALETAWRQAFPTTPAPKATPPAAPPKP